MKKLWSPLSYRLPHLDARCSTCLQGADHPKGAYFTLKSLTQMPPNAKIQVSSLATNPFAFDFTLGSPFNCLVPVP